MYKRKLDPSFPYEWTRPREAWFNETGTTLIRGCWPWIYVRAWFRRHILRKKPLFWTYCKCGGAMRFTHVSLRGGMDSRTCVLCGYYRTWPRP